LPGTDKILAELIKTRGETWSEIHKLIMFGIRNSFVISGRNLLLYQSTKRVIKRAVIIVGYHFMNIIQHFIEYPSL
jgi:hypothetical protein